MLDHLEEPRINVTDVWNDLKKRKVQYKNKVNDVNLQKIYVGYEKKYEKFYKNKISVKKDKEFEIDVYNIERKYLIKNLTEEDHESLICPICGHFLYSHNIECDHILDKKDYSGLSFIPFNIAVVCHSCNHAKGAKNGSGIFNPYIDDIGNKKYNIHFNFDFNNKESICIKVELPDDLKDIFKVYGLQEKVIIDAKNRLNEITHMITSSIKIKEIKAHKADIKESLIGMKYSNPLLEKYRVEYFKGNFIDDLMANFDSYIDYIITEYR